MRKVFLYIRPSIRTDDILQSNLAASLPLEGNRRVYAGAPNWFGSNELNCR